MMAPSTAVMSIGTTTQLIALLPIIDKKEQWTGAVNYKPLELPSDESPHLLVPTLNPGV
jgi:hypothetical protein